MSITGSLISIRSSPQRTVARARLIDWLWIGQISCHSSIVGGANSLRGGELVDRASGGAGQRLLSAGEMAAAEPVTAAVPGGG